MPPRRPAAVPAPAQPLPGRAQAPQALRQETAGDVSSCAQLGSAVTAGGAILPASCGPARQSYHNQTEPCGLIAAYVLLPEMPALQATSCDQPVPLLCAT